MSDIGSCKRIPFDESILRISFADIRPIMLSLESLCTGNLVCECIEYISRKSASCDPLSMLIISVRGVMTSLACLSLNLKTFSSISASPGSTVPSASPRSIIERISPSVIDSSLSSSFPINACVVFDSHCRNKTTGYRQNSTDFSGLA